jgi:uncharacterized protein
MADPDLVVFADRTGPTGVRRELLATLPPDRADEFEAFLVRATLELAVENWPGPVRLCGSPGAALQRWIADSEAGSVTVEDLANRDWNALLDAAAPGTGAAVLGCEVPHCPWDVIDQANDWLARGRFVLGPAEQGGFYFVGTPHRVPGLLVGMDCTSQRATARLHARAEDLGIEFNVLPELHAVHTAHDLWLIAQTFEPLRPFVR